MPSETPVPLPSSTATPQIYVCADIEHAKDTLTDLQWEAYTQEMVGERIRFIGTVIEVYEDGRIQIDDCEKLLSVFILYQIPTDIALNINKDDLLQGEGTIREVGIFLGINVRVNVDSLQD